MLQIIDAPKVGYVPAEHLLSEDAMRVHGDYATRYDHSIAVYGRDGCEPDLWEALRAPGFENAEIQWHVQRRGRRMRANTQQKF